LTFCRQHPRKEAFDLEAIPQYRRFMDREITKDELMLILRDMADTHDLVGYLNWGFWRRDGYALPWERSDGTGAVGETAGQGGTR
jgi:hypothetical protein